MIVTQEGAAAADGVSGMIELYANDNTASKASYLQLGDYGAGLHSLVLVADWVYWDIGSSGISISADDDVDIFTSGDLTLTSGGSGTAIELYSDLAINIADNIFDFNVVMGDSAKNPASDAPDDWVQVKIAGTTYYLPAYTA